MYYIDYSTLSTIHVMENYKKNQIHESRKIREFGKIHNIRQSVVPNRRFPPICEYCLTVPFYGLSFPVCSSDYSPFFGTGLRKRSAIGSLSLSFRSLADPPPNCQSC